MNQSGAMKCASHTAYVTFNGFTYLVSKSEKYYHLWVLREKRGLLASPLLCDDLDHSPAKEYWNGYETIESLNKELSEDFHISTTADWNPLQWNPFTVVRKGE